MGNVVATSFMRGFVAADDCTVVGPDAKAMADAMAAVAISNVVFFIFCLSFGLV
jgi:hypothetical protein